MASGHRVGQWALGSLYIALFLAILGKSLEWSGWAPFWGGLIFAFGEAALVGGLADWFAVRALFAHPLGFPLPHTAIIPQNRPRIIREIRELVQNEWLPRSLLVSKVQNFDFVGVALLPIVDSLKPNLAQVLRSAGRDILQDLSPRDLASFLAKGLAGSIDAEKVGPFLSDLARRAREQAWLEPILQEWVNQIHQWADSPQSKAIIHTRLMEAANAYQHRGWFKRVTFGVAETFGGVDLEAAAEDLQVAIKRFTAEQLIEGSQLNNMVRDGLATVEQRLREDPQFLEDIRGFILQTAETGTLTALLEPVLRSLRDEGQRELDAPNSRFVAVAMHHLELWIERVHQDAPLRDQLNSWCRRLAAQVVEEHHSLVGKLVEEQLDRLSEKNLSELIQARVGEDLNWIRINGAMVGGMVGVVLYLLFSLLHALMA